jgi:tRNA A37 methylthiotransferase MiaB
MKKFVGKNLEVLFEVSKDGYSYGHTANYLHVKAIGLVKSGEFRNVKIINVEYPYVFGELLDED